MAVIGIDPGATGAVVTIYDNEGMEIFPFKNKSPRAIGEYMRNTPEDPIYFEKVHSMPGQGVTSVFSFGQNVGLLKGMLYVCGLDFTEVMPQEWQKELGLFGIVDDQKFKTPAAKKAARKKAYQAFAQKLYPRYADKITLDVADAVLIAEYGRRQLLKE